MSKCYTSGPMVNAVHSWSGMHVMQPSLNGGQNCVTLSAVEAQIHDDKPIVIISNESFVCCVCLSNMHAWCAATEVTRQMFNKAKSTKPSQWRNPNNLHFEALRCIVALQACKPSVATPFREEIVHCLRSSDASLRYLSADVLYNSCSADNLSSVAEQVRTTVLPAFS